MSTPQGVCDPRDGAGGRVTMFYLLRSRPTGIFNCSALPLWGTSSDRKVGHLFTPLIITRGQPWLSTKAEAEGGR